MRNVTFHEELTLRQLSDVLCCVFVYVLETEYVIYS